jgi:autotransporter-associated beta strand protein
VYTIVSSATGGISGTFSGLTNNATFSAGGHTYRIIYSADAVTLTDTSGTPLVFHWIGGAGGTGNQWNVAGNWEENQVPTSGSTVILDTTTPGFNATANGFNPVNDVSSLTNLILVVNDASAAGDFNLTGNPLGLRNTAGVAIRSTLSSGSAVTIANNLTLAASSTIDVGLGTLTLAGVLSDSPGSFALTDASTTGSILNLNAANTYRGGTTLSSGTLDVGTNTSLGTGALHLAGGTLANNNAFLVLANPFSVTTPSTIGGGSFFTLAGNGVLNKNLTLTNSGFLTLSGILSGKGGLIEDGFPGSTTLSGTAANTFTGAVAVLSGGLTLQKSAGVQALVAPVTVTGTFSSLTVSADHQLNGKVAVTLLGGTFSDNGATDSVASVSGTGTISVGTGLSVVGGGAQVFNGTVQGSGTLTYAGSGSLTLFGVGSSFTGVLNAAAGVLAVDAAFSGATGQVSGGTLGGTGILKTITATSGVVNPGGVASDGILTLAGGSQATALSGAGLTMAVDKQSVSSQLVVGDGSTLDLNGATLSVTVLGSSVGSVYTIVSSATGGISGTFSGLADNATFSAGGHTYRIIYSADAVTLTELT